ncbi:glycine/D-amino acid oxidase-like deaminating enzyme [Azorhizobium sp. AG788]|uniref:NAD(P)/FAD-dependent oxidoreductase n=1 Tax=Azorhizobium sp. AG788 TaxID=2183897 RepID=UPI00105F0AD7|nr:FAD-binding oxidoreductase [Azorhizobium sp. AG788]TDU00524.1 glycine/D-amino acid oxidase-like deaminating enzyme [Azorhizobium sp. AG788]
MADLNFDVVIVGGAAVGSSVAYHLAANPDFQGSVLVLEKDPTYQRCASALSAASIRQQYSTAINVDISLYGITFLREIGARLEVDGERPDIGLHEGGYLFLATPEGRPALEAGHAIQQRLGADIAFLEPEPLKATFPWLATEDLAAGCYGRSGEGWFDGYGLLQAFRRKARSLGVTYMAAEAAGVEREGDRVTAVLLADGTRIACGAMVNAAGAGGPALARAAGIEIPVHNKKRMIFTFRCADPVERCPLVIDPTGVYWRPEGEGFLCGLAPPDEEDPDSFEFEVEHAFFEERIWPVLATRVPAFERIRPGRAWAGHYDMNAFDHNAIVGPAPELRNFHFANGFSGHGLQQSPAIGRGISELIAYGRFTTLDLSPLRFARMAEQDPVLELKVV